MMTKARDLKVGQRFRVNPPDPEHPIRVCLKNDFRNGIRWGWPNNSLYWCFMGADCAVEIEEC